MADASYIIDILLKAKDETARALTSATGNLTVFDKAVEKSERDLRDRGRNMGESLDGLTVSQKKLREEMRNSEAQNRRTLDLQVQVERASKNVAASNRDATRSERERLQAQDDLRKSVASLSSEYAKQGGLTDELREAAKNDEAGARAEVRQIKARSTARAQEIRDMEIQIAQARETDKVLRQVEQTRDRIGRSRDAGESAKWQRDLDSAGASLQRLGMDSDKVRVILKDTLDVGRARQFSAANDDIAKAINAQAREVDKANTAYERQIITVAKLRRQRDALVGRGEDASLVQRADLNIADAEAKALELQGIVETLSKQDINIQADINTAGFDVEGARVEAMKAILGSDVSFDLNARIAGAMADLAILEAAKMKAADPPDQSTWSSFFSKFKAEWLESGSSVAAFDNQVRGMITLVIGMAMQPLLTVVIALAAELVALASSAAMAGAALGGALAAGAGQAIPVIGLLIAAFGRMGAVFKAVQQANLLQQQTFAKQDKTQKQVADSANAVANAQDGVRTAQEGVRNANDRLEASQLRVGDAQKKLIETQQGLRRARADAARQLEDMILAEKDAQAAAEGAALSQEEAQRRLQQTVQRGDFGALQQQRLDVRTAGIGRERADLGLSRQSQDVGAAVRGGVDNMQGVVAARKAVEDARKGISDARKEVDKAKQSVDDALRAVTRAQRGVDQAQRGVNVAGAQSLAAAGKLNFMLSNMTGAERKLYASATRISRLFVGGASPFTRVTDKIIAPFAKGLDGVYKLLTNDRILKGATKLASVIGSSFGRLFTFLTGRRSRTFLETMMEQAGKNLPLFTSLVINLIKAFQNLATAGGPVFRRILGWVNDWVKGFVKLTSNTSAVKDFFKVAGDNLDAWLKLGGAIGRLFLAVLPEGAKEGKSSIEALTDTINKATSWLNANQDQVASFFSKVSKVMSDVGRVVIAIGKELFKSFDIRTSKAFADILVDVIVPALGGALRTLGLLIRVLDKLGNIPGANQIAKLVIEFTLVGGIMGKLFTLVRPVFFMFTSLGGVLLRAAGFAGGFRGALQLLIQVGPKLVGAFNPVTLAIALVVAGIIVAQKRTGELTKLFDLIKNTVSDTFKSVKEAFGLVDKPTASQKETLKALKVAWTGLSFVLQYIGTVVLRTIGFAFKSVATIIVGAANVIAGFLRMFQGIVTIIKGVFQGDPDLIKKGFNQWFGGLAQAVGGFLKGVLGVIGLFTSPFRGIASTLGSMVLKGFLAPLGKLASSVGRFFKSMWNWVMDFLGVSSPSKKFMDLGVNVLLGFIRGLANFGSRLLRVWSSGFTAVYEFLRKVPGKLKDFAEEAVKSYIGAWKNVGGKILKAITGSVGSVGGFGKDLVNGIIDLLNEAIPNKIPNPIKDIPLPDNPIPRLRAAGGPVGRGYGGGDRIPILAEDGEWVIRKEAVKAWGEGFIAFINGGGAIPGQRRFAAGGQVTGGKQAAKADGDKADNADVAGESLTSLIEIVKSGGKKLIGEWNDIWKNIRKTSQKGNTFIETDTSDMTKKVGTLLRRLENVATTQFNSILRSGRSRFGALESAVSKSMDNIQQTTYTGLSYLSDATDKALKAFNVDPVNINIPKPKSSDAGGGSGKATGGRVGRQFADGGWVGMMGERGRDMVNTWLGRGEAVLNWGQQKIVDPALRMMYGYGIDDMFQRNRGFHAGGVGQQGFARGGQVINSQGNSIVPINWQGGQGNMPFPGREGTNSSILNLVKKLSMQFKALVTDSFGPGHQSRSHTVTGMAVDWVPGAGGSWNMIEALGKWAVKMGYLVGYGAGVPGSMAWPNHGRGNHIHIDFSTGPGAAGGAGVTFDIPKLDVKGKPETFRKMLQKAMDKVRAGASSFVQSKMPAVDASAGGGATYEGGKGSVAQIISNVWKQTGLPFKALLSAIETGIVESGLTNPSGGDADSVGWRQERNPYGSVAERMNVSAGASRYFNEFRQFNKAGMTAGQVAADVQRPAAQYRGRYDQQRQAALRVIRGLGIRIPANAGSMAHGGIVGMRAGALKALDWARKKIGVAEVPRGSNRGPEVDKIIRMAGGTPGEAWCGDFVRDAAIQGGAPTDRGWASVPSIASGKLAGLGGLLARDKGEPGDLMTMYGRGHVEMIEKYLGQGRYQAIGGNTGQAVKRETHSDFNDLVKVVYPGGLVPTDTGPDTGTDGTDTGKKTYVEQKISWPALAEMFLADKSKTRRRYERRLARGATDFDGWFGERFGIAPDTIRGRYGEFAPALQSVWLGAKNWTQEMLESFRTKIVEKVGKGDGDPATPDTGPNSPGGAVNYGVTLDNRALTAGMTFGGKASEFGDATTASGRQGGMSSHLAKGLNGYWLIKRLGLDKGAVVLRQNDVGPAGWTKRLWDFTRRAMRALRTNDPTDRVFSGKFLGMTLPSGMSEYEALKNPGFAEGGHVGDDDIEEFMRWHRLFGRGKGKFRTRGSYGSGTKRGHLQEFADGGIVNGLVGAATPIIAHAGEWVLNTAQQAKAAMMSGMSTAGFRSAMGFTGGPTSFAGGGEIAGIGVRGSTAGFEPFYQMLRLLEQLQGTENNRKIRARVIQIRRLMKNMTDDELEAVITELKAGIVELKQGGTTKGERGQIRRLTQTMGQLEKQMGRKGDYEVSDTGNQRAGFSGIQRIIGQINNAIRDARRFFGNPQIPDLNNSITGMFKGLLGDSGVLAQVSQSIDSYVATATTGIQKATFQIKRNGVAIRRLSPEDIVKRELNLMQNQYDLLVGQRGMILQGIAAARDGITAAVRKGDAKAEQTARTALNELTGRLGEVNQKIGDAVVGIGQKQEEMATAAVAKINDTAAKATGAQGVWQRIATALGRNDLGDVFAKNQLGIINNQIGDLKKALYVATARGNTELAGQIESSIGDLVAQTYEIANTALQGAIGQVNDAAARQSTRIDLFGRAADLAEGAGGAAKALFGMEGGAVAAARIRGNVSVARGANMAEQRDSLTALLGRAINEGNVGQRDALIAQIEELNMAIAENTLEQRNNSEQIRQATINQIQSRQQFKGGVTSGLSGIIETVGAISGSVDTGRLISLAKSAGTDLVSTGAGLREQLLGSTGVDLRGLTGLDFVDKIKGLDFDKLTEGMTTLEKSGFEALIQAIIDNEKATQDNTQHLGQLTGTISQPQTFASTAWQWFRKAIFDGRGNLLPQYQVPIPQLQTGGIVTKTGLFQLHAGELVVPPGEAINGNVGGEHTHLHIDTPLEVADGNVLAEQFVWKKRQLGKTG